MNVETVVCGGFSSNCYIVGCGEKFVVIDPGFMEPRLKTFAAENKDRISYILLTHGHFDHIGAVSELKKITGAEIVISPRDEICLSDDNMNLGVLSGFSYGHAEPSLRADIKVKNNDALIVGETKIDIIETPGHSSGGVCFLIENCLFSGDTLFYEGIGRTDFPDGSFDTLMASLDILAKLPDETEVYPGHGCKTTIGHEKRYNPYMCR